jgi:hypothetical protein
MIICTCLDEIMGNGSIGGQLGGWFGVYNQTALVGHYQNRELLDFLEIGHSVSESAGHVSVTVSVKFVDVVAALAEDLHISSRSLLLAHKYLNGSCSLVSLYFDFGVVPGKGRHFLGRETWFVLGNCYCGIFDVGEVCSFDDNFCSFFLAGIVNTNAWLYEAVPAFIIGEGVL